jgi:hypothetical protein
LEQKVINNIVYINIFNFIANPELIRANNAKQVFQNRLPLPLREKKPEQIQKEEKPAQPQTGGEDESKKEEGKEQQKKEDISYDVGSEGDKSDDEHKKVDQKKLDKELNQVIYITITETPTTILFYSPSTKYLNLKNGKLNYIIYIFLFIKKK